MANQNCKKCYMTESSRKFAWRSYFSMREKYFKKCQEKLTLLRQIEKLQADQRLPLPQHFKDELISCLKEIECVVCLTEMTSENFNLTKCFHKVCSTCIPRCNNTCPICRKQL